MLTLTKAEAIISSACRLYVTLK